MARPRIEQADRLTKHLPAARCTEGEYASIRAKAGQKGLTMSAYIRLAALNNEVIVKQKASAVNAEIIYELNKVGVNFNQLIKIANSTGDVPAGLDTIFKKLDLVLDHLLELSNAEL